MGTIAALASLVVELSAQGAFGLELGAATLVGGAMFGDNMSVISDYYYCISFFARGQFKREAKTKYESCFDGFCDNGLLFVIC